MALDPNDIPHNAYAPFGRLVFSARSIPYCGAEERGQKYTIEYHIREIPGRSQKSTWITEIAFDFGFFCDPGALPSATERLEQSKLPCACDGVGSILCGQLEKEAADVFLDGGEGNHQAFSDLLIGRTLGE